MVEPNLGSLVYLVSLRNSSDPVQVFDPTRRDLAERTTPIILISEGRVQKVSVGN